MKRILLASLVCMAACTASDESKKEAAQPEAKDASAEKASPTMATPTSVNTNLLSLAANKMDPVCGMPITAGVSDTLSYDGHVLGFCSAECKEEFAKNSKEYKVEYKVATVK
jgi:YHS domain-containing protein